MESVKKSIDERALHKREYDTRVNERQMQITEGKVDTSTTLDASLVDTESSGTESKEQDTSSRSGNDAHADDADIRPIHDDEPMAEVQTTAEFNVFATRQQHTEQPELNNKGEVDQNAEQCHATRPLPAKLIDNQTTELLNQSLKFNTIITSLKALDESFSSRNHVRKFLRALPTKWRLKGKFVHQPHDDKKNLRKIKEDKKEKEDRSDSEDDSKKEEICLMALDNNEVRLKVKLKPDEWIKDSGCLRYMTSNKDLFSSYKAIDRASLRDRLLMLAMGRYAQWRSRFLRYIDTRPNGNALRKCILEAETILNMPPKNKAHFESENEAIHLILTGIGDEIYSTNGQAKHANLLTLVAAAQPYQDPYYQAPKSNKSYAPTSKASLPTRSHATTRHKGKEIAKPITPPSESASEEDSDPEQAQKDKEMQKNLALIAKYFKKLYKPTNNNLRTSSNTRNKNVDTTPRYKNDNQTGQFRNQRTMTVAGAREIIGSQVVQQSGIQCFNYKEFGHFAKECRNPKRVKDSTYHKEKMLMCKQSEKGVPLQAEQSDWLANTDEEIDEQETLEESNTIRDSYLVALQNIQTELEKYKTFNDRTVGYEKLEHKLNETLGLFAQKDIDIKEDLKLKAYEISVVKEKHDEELVDQAWVKHLKDHFRAPTAHDMEILTKTCLMPLALKTQNDSFTFVHELKQEMHADLKYVESLEKEVNELESDKA
ncbi:retrovirus-related pol polyprotein from transposon TNT 1-94 [Tanacetum coccineum]|uniref:Retrovirus-related pol polyprotein from transposon TNT 1-94 n=1 Tax=Tanacetum coccineum TaxID=301880 RepID=A0ABQ5CS98_9ASTR